MTTLAALHFTSDDYESTLHGDADMVRGARMSAAPAPRLEGRCIAGRYLVRELIGEGGFGRVYRAEQIGSKQSVAIKVIGPVSSPASRDVARQFHAEVFASSRVRHARVVATLDHGQTEDGLLYLVMEHVPGRTLASWLDESGALPVERALDLAVEILDAVEAAHAAGVVHADLKSANILIQDPDDQVKLIDFSIARPLHDSTHGAAVWGPGHRIAGTPQYMAPEVVSGRAPTEAADLYAVGVLIHHMLTGELPFAGDDSLDVMMQHLHEPAPRLGERFAHLALPAELEPILLRALAKDPDQRFASAAELRRALQAVRMSVRPIVRSGVRMGAARRCRTTATARPAGRLSGHFTLLHGAPRPWRSHAAQEQAANGVAGAKRAHHAVRARRQIVVMEAERDDRAGRRRVGELIQDDGRLVHGGLAAEQALGDQVVHVDIGLV
jgi:hypothetical protein